MRNFKDLIVWQKAHDLVLLIYQVTKTFPKEEKFNLTSQIRRACTSIPTNIAKGCGKFSQLDFATYLQTSHSSTQEVEYLSFLSFELKYLSEKDYKNINRNVNEVKAMLISLVSKVRESHNRPSH